VLHGNYSTLAKGPGRFFGGSTTSVEVNIRSGFNKPGANRNRFLVSGATTALKLYSVPSGAYAGTAWLLPQSVGAMASPNRNPSSAGAAGSAAAGINIVGTADSTSDASATGQLIVSGSGSAASTSTATGTIQAALQGSGAAASASTATGSITALGWVYGTAASASTASLTAYAVGNMAGTSSTAGALSPEGLAAAVWGADASSNNGAGTMGGKLNAASSGGVDLNALAAAVWSYTVRGLAGTQEVRATEIWQRLGLDPAAPMATGPASITFAGESIAIAESGGTVTLTRQP
jgi:hypothetical protein